MRPIYIFTENVNISINTTEPVTEIKASEPDGVIGAEADIENAISALADVPLCMVHKVMDVLREVCDEIDG